MSHRVLIFSIIAAGVISAAYLVSLMLSTSPYSASSQLLWAFFTSLFLTLTSILALTWYGVLFLMRRRSLPSLRSITRKSSLVSGIIVISLLLNSLGIFKVWDVIPLVVAAILIEFFFQAEKQPQATIEYDGVE